MFKKKNKEQALGTSFDRLLNYNYTPSKSIDEQFIELAEVLMENRPIAINFEEISPTTEVDRAVAFLSGVVYALNGEVHRLGPKTFLFASDVALKDGTIRYYISDVGK
ncbi:MAG: cell division protein SepF [Bacilli bacterium]